MAAQELTPEEKEQIKKLGERIKEVRKAAGYTSYEKLTLAKNISRMNYWRYEMGENMKIINLVRVAKALEIPLDELVKGVFDSPK